MRNVVGRVKWYLYFMRARLKLHLKKTMIEGVLLLVPIAITFFVLRWLWDFFDGVLKPAFKNTLGISFPGLGVAALLVLIYLMGLAWDIDLGRRLLRMGQRFLLSLPIVGTIYSPARQLIDSFSGSGSSGFKRVVFIEYPRHGSWMLGFLTSTTTGIGNKQMGVVYLPTAPTPNSGWVAVVPIEDIYDTDLTVKEAMTMILSGGIVTPKQIKVTSINIDKPAFRDSPT